MKNFPELPPSVNALEEEVLGRWTAEDTFRQSLERTQDGEPFVFFEGPPTANGRPGIHHVFSRTIKDAVARFRTMQGRHVPRIAGWDTHGLPVEIEAEKKLGISGKREIEEIGIARFNEVCRESVLTYTEEWERFSARIGYWLDYSRPYVTYQPEYIESVWWLLKQISECGLFYKGHKVLPYCPRCGTGLSSHELALGYKDVKDPSLYFTAPILGADGEPDGREFLVWTTTPWTVVSNVALAVNAEFEYAEVLHEERSYVLARARVAPLFGSEEGIVRTFSASELVGLRYRRPLDWANPVGFADEVVDRAWKVYPAEWVTAEDGTGIVHTAVAFGADDYKLGQEVGLPIIMPLDDRGRFKEGIPLVAGVFAKDADTDLVIELKRLGRVFRSSREEHSYPHCWRCGSPLLYMARDSWFIRTTQVREQMMANNAEIRWFPPEVGAGRFGEWLENNVDWAISRNRFWGTPLPAWVCETDPSHVYFIGSFDELREKSGLAELPDPHRPYVDEVTFPCECGGTMRRTPEVIDVWFDSGAMPFAQHHYPFENKDLQERQFPADFICEGVDQTRGWFYSLLAISTLLGRGPAYRNVVVNDLVLDAAGQKMSKSRGNTVNPAEAVEQFGADAIRWYLLGSSHPWLPKRFDPDGVKDVQRKTFDTLRQTYRFFALYANLEGFSADAEVPAPADRGVLDRWLLSRLASVTAEVTADLEGYNLTHAVRAVSDFVTDDLSNWYVRRSRDRFWGSADRADTQAAFATLRTALVTTAQLMAPVAPFLSEWLHTALTGESVHLSSFPAVDAGARDEQLERGMNAVRTLSTLGRAAREQVSIRVRQPLGTVYAVVPDGYEVDDTLLGILRDELNVHAVEFMHRAEELVTFSARPIFKALGAAFGKRTPRVGDAVRALASDALSAFRRGERLTVTVDGEELEITGEHLEIVQGARGAFAIAAEGGFTIALDPTLTPELRLEGLARELVNRVQNLRKESGFHVSDRISLGIFGDGEILDVAERWGDFVAGEVLAVEVEHGSVVEFERYEASREIDLDGVTGTVAIGRVGDKD
ncbi:isoleucine--tRNA ligase [Longimicrobium terrae]|uniref:Isoleucine--tRNA ligase n=1 Tax=Longimicrobium terrae TaxID=1639882 RepID=A0A841H4Z5_9BACT|nr:isoleucine--tRNA ligase [Longimicrobium terrae]MBB4638513.1 isoleucyl-tRNA synthetase [Longimicrobium terrae]MBB6072849.1 isoleucyl-tRNA synthetase [Longimicrobium terrae]NNC30534.1 isoleucine--tRNA ligase [Longimicrobium terrae]